MQLIKENKIDLTSTPVVRVGTTGEVTDEIVKIVLRKAVRLTSSIQALDGHWPAENSGPLFYTPPLVRRFLIFYHWEEVTSLIIYCRNSYTFDELVAIFIVDHASVP